MNSDVTQAGQPATPTVDLETLRGELDGIDEQLLAILAARILCCVRIARYKRKYEVPMMQPHRITIVQDRAAAFAAVNGLDRAFIRRFYEMIIAESCRVEEAVIEGVEAS